MTTETPIARSGHSSRWAHVVLLGTPILLLFAGLGMWAIGYDEKAPQMAVAVGLIGFLLADAIIYMAVLPIAWVVERCVKKDS